MIQDVQNLLAVLAGPSELPQQPSLGTTEKAWRQYGIQLVRPGAGAGSPAEAGATGGGTAAAASLAQWQQQHQQQRQAAAAQAASQAAPAPLGLSLLLQQEQQERQTMPPPPPPAAWARGPSAPGVQDQAGEGAAPAGGAAAPPLAADLLFSPSIEMMPVLPTLSQLLEEPMMTLSLKDDGFMAAAAAAATAAVAAGASAAGGLAPGQQMPQQAQAPAPQPAAPPAAAWPLMPVPGGREESLQLLNELLQPVPAELGQVLGAAGVWPPPAPSPKPAAAAAAAHAADGPVATGPPAAALAPAGAAAAPTAAFMQPSTAAKPTAAQVALELLNMPTPPLSPGGSGGEHTHSGGSGSLSYRRVSFTQLHSSARAGAEEGSRTASSRPQPAAAVPFLARPPVVTTAAAPFPARSPAAAALAGAFPAVPPAAAAPAGAFPARPLATLAALRDASPAALGIQTAAPPAPRLAVVQAGGGVRIAQSAAAAVPGPPEEEEKDVHSTAATADGPVTFVSVHEAPPHDFSQGETSLTRLFATVKATGVLLAPTISEGDEEGELGSTTAHSGHSSGSDGVASGSGADSQLQGKPAAAAAAEDGPARHTRHSSRLSAHAEHGQGAAQHATEELGGTKRRKGGR
ncbi:hypothetical protein ABPG75_001377 [Micractinium tetrahymenae]